MCGFKILCEISKIPFETSHKIWNPYTAKCAFYCLHFLRGSYDIFELWRHKPLVRRAPSKPCDLNLYIGIIIFRKASWATKIYKNKCEDRDSHSVAIFSSTKPQRAIEKRESVPEFVMTHETCSSTQIRNGLSVMSILEWKDACSVPSICLKWSSFVVNWGAFQKRVWALKSKSS